MHLKYLLIINVIIHTILILICNEIIKEIPYIYIYINKLCC